MEILELLPGFVLALTASVLALIGNRLMLAFQTKAKVREELRGFIREMHPKTVEWVADLDLFVRSIRVTVATGASTEEERGAAAAKVATGWESDLLRRTRMIRFGHPDPDVRRAAETLEDEMWPYLVAAQKDDRKDVQLFGGSVTEEQDSRRSVIASLDTALTEVRRAVYAAPRRDVPKEAGYDGSNLPSRLFRAMEKDREEQERLGQIS